MSNSAHIWVHAACLPGSSAAAAGEPFIDRFHECCSSALAAVMNAATPTVVDQSESARAACPVNRQPRMLDNGHTPYGHSWHPAMTAIVARSRQALFCSATFADGSEAAHAKNGKSGLTFQWEKNACSCRLAAVYLSSREYLARIVILSWGRIPARWSRCRSTPTRSL